MKARAMVKRSIQPDQGRDEWGGKTLAMVRRVLRFAVGPAGSKGEGGVLPSSERVGFEEMDVTGFPARDLLRWKRKVLAEAVIVPSARTRFPPPALSTLAPTIQVPADNRAAWAKFVQTGCATR